MKKAIVLLQIYALDRLEEISNLLDIHKDTRIAISIGEKNTNDKKIIDFLNKFKARLEDVRFHKNYGVDIAPFLQQVKRLDSDKFPYFIKNKRQRKKQTANYRNGYAGHERATYRSHLQFEFHGRHAQGVAHS